MIEAITKERWNEAQIAEREQHTLPFAEGFAHYEASYKTAFKYLGMEFDQQGKSIIEIGPADFPALAYCRNYRGTIVEPMVSEYLQAACNGLHILLIARPFEEVNIPIKVGEIWLLNVMQHVIDPDLFIAKCKAGARAVRFFEPIDYPTAIYHPHTFTIEDFQCWVGDCVQRYVGGSEPGFHEADCAYGTWHE